MTGEEQAQRLVRTGVLPGQSDRRHGEAPLAAFDKDLEFGDAAKERRKVSARSSSQRSLSRRHPAARADLRRLGMQRAAVVERYMLP